MDEYNLERFIKAQEIYYETALDEIRGGRKESHWMWYIFPQLSIENPILRGNLIEISEAIYGLDDDIYRILGYPDNLKLKSCMTLFDFVEPDIDIFKKVIDKFYDGEKDQVTLDELMFYKRICLAKKGIK